LNELSISGCHQFHLKARILRKLESEHLFEHEQVCLGPVLAHSVAIAFSYVLGIVGVHDEVGNGGLVLKKLENGQQNSQSGEMTDLECLIQVLRSKVEIALIFDGVGRNVGECVMGFVAGAEINVGILGWQR